MLTYDFFSRHFVIFPFLREVSSIAIIIVIIFIANIIISIPINFNVLLDLNSRNLFYR